MRSQKNLVLHLERKKKEIENDTKTKTIIEFNQNLSCSVKRLAVKKYIYSVANSTSRFSSSKMLMIAKISLMSSVYDVLETVYFPNKITRDLYQKYSVKKILLYHVLTDTDSTCLFFVFVCKPECEVPGKKFRNFIIEIIMRNEVSSMSDASGEF